MAALCAGVSCSSAVAADEGSLYCVIDLSGGANAVAYSVSYLDAAPAGGWTDEYKTTKLVMRRIEAGTFKMHGVQDVTLTRAYYIGVFEVTQRQYELVMGTNPVDRGDWASYYLGDTRPVESVSWNAIRGASGTYDWPSVKTVDANSFIGRIRARTGGLNVDLPTYAQWERACRAGGDERYDRESFDADTLNEIARWYENGGKGDAKYAAVGSYLPNAWGLYDMIGNVNEWCLDWYGETLSYGVNPVGATTGDARVICGGAWWTKLDSELFNSYTINKESPATGDSRGIGLRLVGNTDGEVDHLRVTAIAVDDEARTATLEAAYSMAWGEPDPVDFKVKYFTALDEVETQVLEPVGIPVLDRERGLATLTVDLPEGAIGFMRVIVVQ